MIEKGGAATNPPRRRRWPLLLFLGSALLCISYSLWPQSNKYAVCSQPGSKQIYTVDSKDTKVECIMIEGTKVGGVYRERAELDVALSYRSELRLGWLAGYIFRKLRRLEVKQLQEGEMLIPGMSDPHVHALEYGYSRLLPLDNGKSIPDTVSLVRNYVLSDPDILHNKSRVIEGWGWDRTIWPHETYPTYSDIESDPILTGRSIFLRSKDGHTSWVSKAVLDVNAPYPDTWEGGVIMRDENGDPTGIFQDAAQSLLKPPQLTDEDLRKRFMITARDALQNGITCIHDAASTPPPPAFFKRLADKELLPIRLYAMAWFNESGEYVAPSGQWTNRLYQRGVKIVGDGSMRSGSAYLFEPYSDDSSTRGFMRHNPEVLMKRIPELLELGWQVNAHAIGDHANAIIMDAFELAQSRGVNLTERRVRIEHAQIQRPEDTQRMGRLGVIGSVQSGHVIDDAPYALSRLGPERIDNLYAFRRIADAGSKLILGSDIPVSSINPIYTFWAAVTRGGWHISQTLTPLETLRALTIDPAYASFQEDLIGSLEVGKEADFVVLSKDIMSLEWNYSVSWDEVKDTKVKLTVLGGEVVWGVWED